MPDNLVSASVRPWEDGTDLVLSVVLPSDVDTAWLEITDPVRCGEWFAPWRRVNGADAGTGDSGTGDADGADDEAFEIAFFFGEDELGAQVLSVQSREHVFLEISGLGRVGISLDGGPRGSAPTTVIVTHTFESERAARAAIPEIGPVWHTHLVMLAAALGANAPHLGESELTDYYTAVAGAGPHDGE